MKMVHITIHTSKLKESVNFYQSILGMSVRTQFSTPDGKSIVFMSDDEDDTAIELIDDGKSAYTGKGLSIGFHVPDVKKAHEQMKQDGFNPSPLIKPNPKTEFFFISDPNGVSIQLI